MSQLCFSAPSGLLLATHPISGVPVVDEGEHVIGIASEADLIDEHKRERHIPRVALNGIFPILEDLLAEAAGAARASRRVTS